eukprot:m.292371 g.292371  ORF g.292371 m.292371 type:complete len:76 (+) comp55112_c3_seq12:1967-2194(+)
MFFNSSCSPADLFVAVSVRPSDDRKPPISALADSPARLTALPVSNTYHVLPLIDLNLQPALPNCMYFVTPIALIL